jgi:hypothetical protein
MIIKTVTTFNNRLYEEYAHKFMSTYNWPFELIVYSEDRILNVETFDTFDLIPQCKEFVERNKNRQLPDLNLDTFKYDAVRFCYKVYVYTHEILKQIELGEVDGLICIDADSVFYNPINVEWMKKHIHRDDCMLSYLGRPDYSECGYLYFNLRHPDTKKYATEVQKMYNSDMLYNEQEWHDSWIWDVIRIRFENILKTLNHNIGDGKRGHVQSRSILGQVYDHTKGPRRKRAGRSWEFVGHLNE